MVKLDFQGRVPLLCVTLALLFIVCIAASGLAAESKGLVPGAKGAQGPGEPEMASVDPIGRSTPQGTVLGFIKSAKQGDYEQALRYLDTKKTGISAQKLIGALLIILDRGFSGRLGFLSNKPEGSLDDNLPPSQERIGTVETPSGSFDVLLERVQPKKGPPIWLFSAETLREVPEYYQEVGYPHHRNLHAEVSCHYVVSLVSSMAVVLHSSNHSFVLWPRHAGDPSFYTFILVAFTPDGRGPR